MCYLSVRNIQNLKPLDRIDVIICHIKYCLNGYGCSKIISSLTSSFSVNSMSSASSILNVKQRPSLPHSLFKNVRERVQGGVKG